MLTREEKDALGRLESKLQHVRDSVRGVVREFHTGLFLHGEGGTSKSYTVVNELARLKARYVYHNTRLTAWGLVDALERSPTDTHLIEDAETLLDDKKAFGVLRSALWSQSTKKPVERNITWTTMKADINFVFTGGIIVISNVNLAETISEIRAIKSRINVLGIDIATDEIKALMVQICSKGYQFGEMYLDARECLEVKDYVVQRLSELRRNLDLRLLINGFRDMLQWKQGESTLHWHELLAGRMSERVQYVDQRQRTFERTKAALAIRALNLPWAEQLRRASAVGLTKAAYARAIKRPI